MAVDPAAFRREYLGTWTPADNSAVGMWQPSSGPIRAYHAVFEDGPAERPVLVIPEWGAWPEHFQWQACDEHGRATIYYYRHVHDGHYWVHAWSRLELSEADIQRGRELRAMLVDGFTEPSAPDTSQPYFLDLIRRIDDVTAECPG